MPTAAVFIAAPTPVITAQPMIAVTSVATSLSAIFTTYCWWAIVSSDQVKTPASLNVLAPVAHAALVGAGMPS